MIQGEPQLQQFIVEHFSTFMQARTSAQHIPVLAAFLKHRVSEAARPDLVTDIEIKQVLFSLARNKSPDPDGFPVECFIDTWPIVKNEVISAIKEFFLNGKILKEANSTAIALMPKCDNPSKITDFRPISCCNTIYKCIAKILANRCASILPLIVNLSQGVFVKGRKITNNILLAQELFHEYHLKPYLPRVTFKVDMMKSYDTLNWTFLEHVLLSLGFPAHLISWIMQLFPARNSLLVSMMSYMAISLLEEDSGKDIWDISKGELPVKYFGVPFTTKKLRAKECRTLIDKIAKKATNCANRSFSYAERTLLVKSVLLLIQVFWSCAFVLHKAVILEMEKICRRFLWKGQSLQIGGAKVSWSTVCLPKEGGLGLRKLQIWNKALILKHIWALVAGERTLWTEWIHSNLIVGDNFWTMKIPKAGSWCWRQILHFRPLAQGQVRWQVGDGRSINLWNGLCAVVLRSLLRPALSFFKLWQKRWKLFQQLDTLISFYSAACYIPFGSTETRSLSEEQNHAKMP